MFFLNGDNHNIHFILRPKISNALLNINGDNKILSLFLILKGMLLMLHCFSKDIYAFCVNIFKWVNKVSTLFSFAKSLYHERVLSCMKAFFLSIVMIIWFLSLIVLHSYILRFSNVKLPLYFWNKSQKNNPTWLFKNTLWDDIC